MYYVINAQDFVRCVRVTGIRPDWEKEEIPSDVRRFDYDDEKLWPDQKLSDEYKRVSDVHSESDVFACFAVEAELRRRHGEPERDVYDDRLVLVTALNGFDDEDPDIGEEDDDDEFDEFAVRKPVIAPEEIDLPTMALIHDLAANELDRINHGRRQAESPDQKDFAEAMRRSKQYEDGNKLRLKLMSTDFADNLIDGFDTIEDMKIVAAHLFFLYAQERQKAEQEGRKVNEDYYYAACNLFECAAIYQIAEESDLNVLPEEETTEMMANYAEALNEYIRNAAADDELLKTFEEPTEQFLKEKGFDLSTLAGLKAAQVWLEKARPEDAFATEGPIDNEVDWHMGEARLDGMLKIVKARIQKLIEGKNNK